MPVSVNPPLMAIASVPSHNFQNIDNTKEMVVNFPTASILDKIWITGEKFPLGINELKKAVLTQTPSKKVSPPKIKECFAHMECRIT